MRLWEEVPLDVDLTQAALAKAGLPMDGKELALPRTILVEERQEDGSWEVCDTIIRFTRVIPMFNAMRNYWLRTGNRITIFMYEEEACERAEHQSEE